MGRHRISSCVHVPGYEHHVLRCLGAKAVTVLIIHEWPTEGGICREVVDEMPATWDEDETYYRVVRIHETTRQEMMEMMARLDEEGFGFDE